MTSTSNKAQPTAIGAWNSPVTAESLSQANVRLAEPAIADGCTYWLEGRPSEKGRTVLIKRSPDGQQRDLTPAPYNVRTRVHEYGGGAYIIGQKQVLFVNFEDQGIYQIQDEKINLIHQTDGLRFANLLIDPRRNSVIAVAEDHRHAGEAQNFLCRIDLDSGALDTIDKGSDFYSSPTLDSQQQHLAWLSWMHPNMPWEVTQLNIAHLDDQGAMVTKKTYGSQESIFQPVFGPDDRLYFASDHSNWWNIYVLNDDLSATALAQQDAEFGMPQWVFNMRTFGFIDQHRIVSARTTNGVWDVCQVDIRTGLCESLTDWRYSDIEHLATSTNEFVCLAGSVTDQSSIVQVQCIDTHDYHCDVVQVSSPTSLDSAYISAAQPIVYATSKNEQAHGFYYPPCNPNYCHPKDQLPPLLITVHGGPTTATGNGFNPRVQFWTSRGFAVLDVNYRGSTGFGREYRTKLNGNWGIDDVQDCVHGGQYLIDQQLADANKTYIMGGSAGGYTVLGALAFTDFFNGGISLYGVADLAVLMDDTHKFESRYTISLVGPYDDALYKSRSPLFSADAISAPVLFFQGTDDKVVPPNQAELMVAALQNNGIENRYVTMQGEGHGFRRSDSIQTLLNTSLEFLCSLAAKS